ncbi:hypothetical protein [Sulfitobacter sp. 20_GPM-1509m]|uniref:hypothetical protein n=1 Tax=Sulfitobacter sp. 20_GPM-1509m TaxID=1380367 RepID=UPI00049010FC|nr:hypothetical protein [Sulfitobacter sp. 20_GPM-1509m]
MTRISSIYSRAHADPPTGAEAERRNQVAFQEAWQLHGLFCIDPTTIQDDWTRQVVVNLANQRYMKRAET